LCHCHALSSDHLTSLIDDGVCWHWINVKDRSSIDSGLVNFLI